MQGPIVTIGKYEIGELIATGGMAAVYRARIAGPMGFEKPVAVKVLLEEAAKDEEIVRMFIDEARLGARLSHPNIAAVLDFGEVEGRYFIAMEYVDGTSLWELLKRLKKKALDEKAAIYIAQCVLRALAYAHGLKDENGRPLGIVHRDVSPQNILLDRSGAVKLCDFGIAAGMHRVEKTRVGVVKGKVAYMSHEQAASEPLDARSDIFSLGVTLYVMLGGALERPESPLKPEAVQTLQCSNSLKEILQKALAPKREDRFQTADDFLKAIAAAGLDPGEAGRLSLIEALQSLPTQKTKVKQRQPPRIRKPVPSETGHKYLLLVLLALLLVATIMALIGVRLIEPNPMPDAQTARDADVTSP